MNIVDIFETIQDRLDSDDLNGEFILHKNSIVWSYRLDNQEEDEICYDDSDDFDFNFSFNTASSEELLQDAYIADSEKLESLLDELDENDNWKLTDPSISKCVISFKISKK